MDGDVRAKPADDLEILVAGGISVIFSDDDGVFGESFELLLKFSVPSFVSGYPGDGGVVMDEQVEWQGRGEG